MFGKAGAEMTREKLESLLKLGESIGVEFKRCGNNVENDVYETVCSFLNRFGGDILLGVLNDGTVCGVPKNAAEDMVRNIIKVISNPVLFNPTVYLSPEIVSYEGKTIIHIYVPTSSEVHSFKKVIYDRVDDADVQITSTSQLAAMYIRKQNVFTEKRIYKYITKDDLRMDLLPLCRQRAINKNGQHPWKSISDDELLKSAGLYGEDYATGDKGYNLAAVMLLGKDDVIKSVVPTYKTDALLRKVNIDRYDDREIIATNLVQSFDLLMEFARKHLWDKFYLEDEVNVSLRDRIAREMLANTLIHREYTSSFVAKFVIEKDKMYIENACRASKHGEITPENLNPMPKNPIIASFFNQIGNADELGSGTRNLYKYSKLYSDKEPELTEGDVFRIIVPLDETFSFDLEKWTTQLATQLTTQSTTQSTQYFVSLDGTWTDKDLLIIDILKKNPTISQGAIAIALGMEKNNVKYYTNKLKKLGVLEREGNARSGKWIVKVPEQT